MIPSIYNVPFRVIITGFRSAVLTISKTVPFAAAVLPLMSVLQPDMKLKKVLSLTIPHDPLESGKTSPYETAKSKAEVIRYLMEVVGFILRVSSLTVRLAEESLLYALLSTGSINHISLSVSLF